MGMTEEQIRQAQSRLHGEEVVDGEFQDAGTDEDVQPQPAVARPESPNGLLTLAIAPVAGYLVAFTATTWFELGLAGLLVLAVATGLVLRRRFLAGFAGVCGLVVFAGVAGAYRMQDTPVIARYAAPYVETIDGDYLCRAVVCRRAGPAAAGSRAGFAASREADIAHGGGAAAQTAGTDTGATVQSSDAELAALRALQADERAEQAASAAAAAEQQRLAELERQRQQAAQLRQQQVAEQQAEQQRREREADREKDRNYRAAIGNFRFPSSNCRRPAVPSTDASDYTLTRFDNAVESYSDCVADAIRRDEQTVAALVAQLDGSFEHWNGGYSVEVWQRFSEPLQDIIDSLVDRKDRRVQRHNELADAIDRRNERVVREEYWAGIQESVDRFEYEMEQQRRSTWETWTNNNVYVSPGYN